MNYFYMNVSVNVKSILSLYNTNKTFFFQNDINIQMIIYAYKTLSVFWAFFVLFLNDKMD